MKQIIILFLSFSLFQSISAQSDASKLNIVNKTDTHVEGQAIVYGLFIQRMEKGGKGSPQYIMIENTTTRSIYLMQVKAAGTPNQNNIFCLHIPPGTYRITHYYWMQGKWYGSRRYTEPIYKDIRADRELQGRIEDGELDPEKLERYTFTIRANRVNYLGTWHFDTNLPSFSNDKSTLDVEMGEIYTRLNFNSALIAIPK